ncbi:hypothetical protein EMCG_02840 [[Emmonsia] crescens]|uniref:Uncharacterized protein n=1 Tax=[Emmonsia] crescens TaxID=73230 RepID=A0A0G2HYF9_9EURO|nr:hypothetical protein EMCG_02840 [Emmonsia crescens UAMH 3008]
MRGALGLRLPASGTPFYRVLDFMEGKQIVESVVGPMFHSPVYRALYQDCGGFNHDFVTQSAIPFHGVGGT